jgi:hypothetical protein
MSLLVRTSTDVGALLVRDTDDPFALAVTESTSPLALRVRESTDPLAMRVRGLFSPASLPGLAAWYDASDSSTVLTQVGGGTNFVAASSQFLECPSTADFNAGTGSFTASLWVNSSNLASKGIFGKDLGGSSREIALYLSATNTINFAVWNLSATFSQLGSSFELQANTWYHIVFGFNSTLSRLELSVNNSAQQTFSVNGIIATSAPIHIGRQLSGYLTGAMDEITFHKRVLTADERTFLFNGGAGRTYAEAPASLKTDLVSWWSMNAPATGDWLDQHGTNHLTPSVSRPTATTGVTFNVAQNGQTVRRWVDKSGNGRHLEQGDLVKQPAYGTGSMTGGFPSLTADGSNDDMKTAAFTLNQPYTAYLIVEYPTVSANGGIFDGATSNRSGITLSGNEVRFVGGVQFGSGLVSAGTKYFLGAILNGNSSTGYQNGFEGSAVSGVTTNGLDLLTLFARGGGNFNNMRCAECIIYGFAHDLATVRKVRAFLTRKWGITL